MKKIFLITFMIILVSIILGNTVLAAEPTITLSGDSEKKAGETGEILVKVSSQDILAGVVSGKLKAAANLDKIKCTAKNGWNITYNDVTGEFNIYKAEGTKEEEIFTIEYYVKDNAKEIGTITLSDLKVTTTDYQTKEIADVQKDITITTKTQQDTENNNSTNKIENNIIIDNSTNENNVIVENSTSQNKTETESKNNNIVIKDSTTSKKSMPKTGKESNILPIICLVIVILAIVTYIGYKK